MKFIYSFETLCVIDIVIRQCPDITTTRGKHIESVDAYVENISVSGDGFISL
jgi:hypothetical protein